MDKQNYYYLLTFAMLTLIGTNIQTDGSNVQEFSYGVMTGLGLVGCIISLWTIGKARKSKAQ